METVLVTGGSGAIGSKVVSYLSKNGYRVLNFDIVKPKHISANVQYFNIDLTDEKAIDKLYSENFDGLKINHIVSLAGGALEDEWKLFNETDFTTIRDSIALNLVSHIRLVHQFIPNLLSTDGNRSITLISSVNGICSYRLAGYSSAKAGLLGFMYGISNELGQQNIRINTITPGTVKNKKTLMEKEKDWGKLSEKLILKQFTTSEDIASAVHFLITNQSITSMNLVIDAGQSSKG